MSCSLNRKAEAAADDERHLRWRELLTQDGRPSDGVVRTHDLACLDAATLGGFFFIVDPS